LRVERYASVEKKKRRNSSQKDEKKVKVRVQQVFQEDDIYYGAD